MSQRGVERISVFSVDRYNSSRSRSGLSIDEIAKILRLESRLVSGYGTGLRNPSFQTLVDLAAALHVDPLELTTEDPDQPTIVGLRLRAGLSRQALADRLGITYAGWRRIECGERRIHPPIDQRAAELLNVDVAALHTALGTSPATPDPGSPVMLFRSGRQLRVLAAIATSPSITRANLARRTQIPQRIVDAELARLVKAGAVIIETIDRTKHARLTDAPFMPALIEVITWIVDHELPDP